MLCGCESEYLSAVYLTNSEDRTSPEGTGTPEQANSPAETLPGRFSWSVGLENNNGEKEKENGIGRRQTTELQSLLLRWRRREGNNPHGLFIFFQREVFFFLTSLHKVYRLDEGDRLTVKTDHAASLPRKKGEILSR